MSDDNNVTYMDDWLRTHGRSVPMSRNGVQLNWSHTDQAFDAEEIKAWFDKGIVETRTFTQAEMEAMEAMDSEPKWIATPETVNLLKQLYPDRFDRNPSWID